MYCHFNISDENIMAFVDRMADELLTLLDTTFSHIKTEYTSGNECSKRAKSSYDDLLCTKLYVKISDRLKVLIDDRQRKVENAHTKAEEELSITKYTNKAPKFPSEIIANILSFVPYTKKNSDKWVDGLHNWLPHVTIDPSLRLRATINRKIDIPNLIETMSMDCVDLNVIFDGREDIDKSNSLLLLQSPHRWKEVTIEILHSDEMLSSLVMLKSALPYIDQLCIKQYDNEYEVRNTKQTKLLSRMFRAVETQITKLDSAEIPMIYTPILSEFHFIRNLTTLKLTRPYRYNDEDDSRYDTALLDSLPLVSRLPKLKNLAIKLATWGESKDNRWSNHTVRQVRSNSLRSLFIDGRQEDCLLAYTALFSDCPNIESITISAYDGFDSIIQELHKHFSTSLKWLAIYDSTEDKPIKLDPLAKGIILLPNLECIEILNKFKESGMQFQSELLRTIRARMDDPNVKKIKHVAVPRRIVDELHQYELNALVPSVVLRDDTTEDD